MFFLSYLIEPLLLLVPHIMVCFQIIEFMGAFKSIGLKMF